ncbi:MAG: hypothetical protein GY705_17690 [Bacteroidetes bacterium]|nr:hypothetical protein [Bacteroidota bacterium]
MKKLDYKRIFLGSLLFFVLGVVFKTVLKESANSLGTVFIAVGSLFLIASMAAKRNEEKKEE